MYVGVQERALKLYPVLRNKVRLSGSMHLLAA